MLHAEGCPRPIPPVYDMGGAVILTFTPSHQPGQATCIDHLTIWDPRHLADQIGGTTTLTSSFSVHKGVLGIIHIPVLTGEVSTPPPTMTPRVHTFKFPVPEEDIETWRSKVAVDSATVTALASVMASTLLDSVSAVDN